MPRRKLIPPVLIAAGLLAFGSPQAVRPVPAIADARWSSGAPSSALLLGEDDPLLAVPRPDRSGIGSAGPNVRVNSAEGDLITPCTTQSETSLVALDENRVVVGFNDSGEGCIALDSYTGFAYSTNGGQSFTDGGRVIPPAGGFSGGDPSLAADRQGRIYLATLENASGMAPVPRIGAAAGRSYLGVRTSDDGGQTWSAPADATAGLNGSHDKELITVDNSGGPFDGTVYAVWTDFVGGQGRGVIRLSRSTDRGQTFSTPIALSRNHSDYNQGATPAVGPDGQLYVVWQTQLTQTPSIYFTVSLDGGQTFSFPRRIRTTKAVGSTGSCGSRNTMTGNIRMLNWPVIAVDQSPPGENSPRGTIYLAYGSKDTGDGGNIYLLRSTDGGETWDPPAGLGIRVNDDATTGEQFMPAIAVRENGEVALSWFDRRSDPASNVWTEVWAARSLDAGLTWGPNVRVSDEPFQGVGNSAQRDPGVADCYMGDYNQMIPFRDGYAMAWGDNRDAYPVEGGVRTDPNVYFSAFTF